MVYLCVAQCLCDLGGGKLLKDWFIISGRWLVVASKYPLKICETKTHKDLGFEGSLVFASYEVQHPINDFILVNVHLRTPRRGLDSILDGRPNLQKIRTNYRIREFEAKNVAEHSKLNTPHNIYIKIVRGLKLNNSLINH